MYWAFVPRKTWIIGCEARALSSTRSERAKTVIRRRSTAPGLARRERGNGPQEPVGACRACRLQAEQLGAPALDALDAPLGSVLDPAQPVLDILDQPAVDPDDVRDQPCEERLGPQAGADRADRNSSHLSASPWLRAKAVCETTSEVTPTNSRHAPISAKKRNGR